MVLVTTHVLDIGDSSRTSFLFKASTLMITSKISGTLAHMDLEHLIIQIRAIYVGWEREKEKKASPKGEAQSSPLPE